MHVLPFIAAFSGLLCLFLGICVHWSRVEAAAGLAGEQARRIRDYYVPGGSEFVPAREGTNPEEQVPDLFPNREWFPRRWPSHAYGLQYLRKGVTVKRDPKTGKLFYYPGVQKVQVTLPDGRQVEAALTPEQIHRLSASSGQTSQEHT
jgi:hypothetical protein